MAHKFPQETYRKLDGVDLKLLNEIAFLSRKQKQRTGSAYCCPGRAYLAEKLGVDIGTISRHTSKLLALGVLDKVQRRPLRGRWQTCLYKLRSWDAWALGRVTGFLRKIGAPHRVRPGAHKAFLRRKIETPDGQSRLSEQILEKIPLLQRWIERGNP